MAKKDKKKTKQDDYWDTDFQQDAATVTATDDAEKEDKKDAEGAAPDDGEEEFGGLLAAIKKNKEKKAKKQKQIDFVDANEELAAMEQEEAPQTNGAAKEVEKEEPAEDGEFRVKTKKEKEKEKKEKEKAKKKAQAEQKKGATAPAAEPEPKAAPEPAEQAGADGEDADDVEEGTGSKSKKKKKKPAPKKEEPAPAATKRKGPNISALQQRIAAQKAAEEARRKAEEEEKKRIEEEERRIAEEEARKEEEKRLKKEREKAKREELRKKGLLLSKKQKEQQRMAALRHEQMLAAGNVTVAGLSGDADGQKPKRPVYGNKRKPRKEQDKATLATTEETAVEDQVPESPKPQEAKQAEPVKAPEAVKEPEPAEDDIADSWEEAAVADSWEDQVDEDGNVVESKATAPEVNGKKDGKPVKEEEGDEEDEEDDEDEDSEDEEDEEEQKQSATQKLIAQKKAEAAQRREEEHQKALAARSADNLRSPICCILGHVDTGKTKLLDKIRQTNVQEGEAGGITQQIGATYFPLDAIKMKTAPVNKDDSFDFKIPGLLVIDTPGHESFTNLRSRGSSLCNIAILVIDIMHGLEPQTLESIRLLRDRKTPFIVALNKIDRIYGWNPTPNGAFQESLAKQNRAAQTEFKSRADQAILALKEQGLNSYLYYENPNFGRNVSIVPTSAHTGEGIPDMLMLLVKLTQDRMTEKLMYLSELECTVLEVKVIEGLGTTIDVILSNGVLHEGDRIVLCGTNGPIITNIRALLTPEPLKEMRVKSAYVHHKEVRAALGVKITAQDLGNAIAGSRLLVVGPGDDEDDLADEVMSDLEGLMSRVDKKAKGVCVQASTLGSLEALLEFLKTSNIAVTDINIGPVHKKDVMRCAPMLERAPEFAVMLCFDVKIDKEAEELAAELGVKIFSANIIYHLFDKFTAYQKELLELKRKEAAGSAVFPCVLRIIQIFHSRDPIILGVDVVEGSIRVGTPIAAVKVDEVTKEKTVYNLGKVLGTQTDYANSRTSIEQNHKSVDVVKKGQSGAGVAVRLEGATQQLFGRHIDEKETLYSHITRHSIDTLKSPAMKDDVTREEWQLIVKLKSVFGI